MEMNKRSAGETTSASMRIHFIKMDIYVTYFSVYKSYLFYSTSNFLNCPTQSSPLKIYPIEIASTPLLASRSTAHTMHIQAGIKTYTFFK